MSEDSRPLHVQLGEALGWKDLHQREDGLWLGIHPQTGLNFTEVTPIGWCSMGPLVERLGLDVSSPARAMQWVASWRATEHGYGKTPCEAIARLIITLHKEGKLPK